MKKLTRASGNMRNIYLFLKWCAVHSVRWVMTCPRRLHNSCIKYIEKDSTDAVDIVFGAIIASTAGTVIFIITGLMINAVFGIHHSVFLLIVSIPIWFILSVFIRVAYRKFRREQDEIFETLKGDYRA